MSPSKQDSPKVPEQEWPWPTHTIARVLVKLARGPVVPGNYFYAIRFGDEPTDDEETYIPVSALLSDEAKRAVTEVLDDEFAAETGGEAVADHALAQRLLQVAIEQVGGAK